MPATEYLFAVQDATGREVCSARLVVEKVSTISAQLRPGQAAIVEEGTGTIALGDTDRPADELALLRWPARDKLARPIRKTVAS